MKILAIDIETSPNLADVWGLWNQNVSLSQLRQSSRMISFAAKFLDEKKVYFYSDFHHGHTAMVSEAHVLLTKADALLHFNGNRFDIPALNSEFLLEGLTPPAPSKNVDLYRVAKKNFKFPSYKLQYISTALGLAGKVHHEGHALWTKCMSGDAKAWARMKKYNVQDILLLEELYEKLLPWIDHPHRGLYSGNDAVCSNCGSEELIKEGFSYTGQGKYQRFSCKICGRWSRGTKRIGSVSIVKEV